MENLDNLSGAIKLKVFQELGDILVPLLSDVWKNDKTVYTYTGRQAQTRDGAMPKEGKRFLSPREMVKEFAQEHGFWKDIQQHIGNNIRVENGGGEE